MSMNKIVSFVTLFLLIHATCVLSQQDTDITALINTIYTPNNTQTNNPQPSRSGDTSFDTIVTPVPLTDGQSFMQFNTITGQPQCNCVPYHKCDPTTNEVRNEGDDDQSAFDGFGKIDLRSGDPVCEHFLDVCCDTNKTHSESLTPRQHSDKGCGIRNVGGIDFTLVGDSDNEAGFGEFPWTVALLKTSDFSYFCSGSLIHPRVVLTALHCIRDVNPDGFVVRAGEWDSQTTRERLPYQERIVERIINHPQFNTRSAANDYALIVLSEAVVLSDHINVVCLPDQDHIPPPGTMCYSTGWGKDVFGAAGRFSAIMKRIALPTVEFNRCQSQLRQTRLGYKFQLDPSFMCAGGEEGIDTCEGDGGAPLVCPIQSSTENRFYQSGIVAWGIGCNQNIPAAYANVAKARNWIDDQMLILGFGTSTYQFI